MLIYVNSSLNIIMMHFSSCLNAADRNDPYEVKFSKLRYFWEELSMQNRGNTHTVYITSDTEVVIKFRRSLKCILNDLNNLQFYKTPNHYYLCRIQRQISK